MTELDVQIAVLTEAASDSYRTIRRETERTGKEGAGCFLGFIPEELIYAADLLPVGLWGEETELVHAKKYVPPFFCAPVQQMLEMAMRGNYTGLLKVMVMPVYCDTLRSAGQNFKIAVPDIPMLPIVYPANRKKPSGITFLASEFRGVQERLEELTGRKITEEKLNHAFVIYNRFRFAMRDFLKTAESHPEIISPSVRHHVIKASFYLDKQDFTKQLKLLTSQLNKLPPSTWRGEKVILTGVLLDSPEILKELEQQNIAVAADYLLMESLQFQRDVPEVYGDDTAPLTRLACRFGQLSYCSAVMDPEKGRITQLVKDAGEKDTGVIICMPSFCDPEEYDYPLLKKALEEAGIPNVCIELHTKASVEQAKTKLQAFTELGTLKNGSGTGEGKT